MTCLHVLWGGGRCVLITQSQAIQQARGACVGGGGGEGKGVEQQIGAPGNPCSPFSSFFSLLCIRRGFDKNPILGSAVQMEFSFHLFFYSNLHVEKRMLRIRDVYRDPHFFHSGSEFFLSRIRIKEFWYFSPKKFLYALGNMIRVVHPGSGSCFNPSHPGSGSASLRKTSERNSSVVRLCWI